MQIEDFYWSAAFSAAAIAVFLISDQGAVLSLPFALSLFALSQAAFFAIISLREAGTSPPYSEYLSISANFAGFLICALSFFAFSAILPLSFLPAILSAPAAAILARRYISG
ncbi:MAG: hypothetical protein N3G22_02835 [Candidatus Micrarchaeota archaeon]|nr:hypothetical protein [Candidatus Micrarchaeota archaeon]